MRINEGVLEAVDRIKRGVLTLESHLLGQQNEPDPPEAQRPEFDSLMVVGHGEAKPGEVATVEVLGGTTFETRLFALAIGVRPESKLELVGHQVAPELKALLGITDPQETVRHQKGDGWYENFIQVQVAFFRSLGDVLEIDPETTPKTRPKREIVDVVIPFMTPIWTLDLRVPDDVPKGARIHLDLEHTHGRNLSGAGAIKQIDWPSLYGTARDVKRTGVYPTKAQRVSGWVDVV